MCYDTRLVKGELPGCVEACPSESFTFGKRTDLLRIARERIRRYPGRYLDHIYGENEMGLGITPAPQFTSSALAAVPMVVGTWPLLLMGIYAMSKRKDKIAKEEKEQALAEVTAQVKAEADQKVSEAWKKASQEKEKAIEAAVKQALEAAADVETEENS
jgi:Fe-S-cluster-containing dehydrogenase component